MVLFELKLHCLEGPLNAGMMQCPDGSGNLQSNAGQMLQSPQFLMVCFDTVLGCLGKKKKKKLFCFNVVVLFFVALV